MTREDSRPSILLLAVEDGQRKVLVSQPALYVGMPTLSPDGSQVAYVQGSGFLAGDIHVVPTAVANPVA